MCAITETKSRPIGVYGPTCMTTPPSLGGIEEGDAARVRRASRRIGRDRFAGQTSSALGPLGCGDGRLSRSSPTRRLQGAVSCPRPRVRVAACGARGDSRAALGGQEPGATPAPRGLPSLIPTVRAIRGMTSPSTSHAARPAARDPIRRTTMMWGTTPQRRSRWLDESVGSSATSAKPRWSPWCARPGGVSGRISRDLDLTETAVRGWVQRADVDAGSWPRSALGNSSRERCRARGHRRARVLHAPRP
jgi:hypothetical protein